MFQSLSPLAWTLKEKQKGHLHEEHYVKSYQGLEKKCLTGWTEKIIVMQIFEPTIFSQDFATASCQLSWKIKVNVLQQNHSILWIRLHFDTFVYFILNSGEHMEMSQKLIPGTSRSAVVYKTSQTEYTVEVYRIKELVMADGKDYVGIRKLVVNVGFAASTLFQGPQPDETPDEWQKAILNILQIWRPQHQLLIRTWNPDISRKALTSDFISHLRRDTGFDIFEDRGYLKFLRMYVL